jgi:pimeloyl-ACP methyl ester carboxylesterase
MLATQIDPAWRDGTIRTNGVDLHVVEAGPLDGPVVVLLHGFPEFWYAWKHYLNSLAAAGHRIIVPDQRGYNLSAHPPGVAPYNIEKLAADVVGLIDAAGRQRAVLVGHDWGGYVAWWTAARYPSRIERLVTINCPHPRTLFLRVLMDPRQMVKSWYMLVLQIPWLPEWILSYRAFAVMRWFLRWSGDDGPMSADDQASYVEAWSRPQALTTMINWYRAAFRTRPITLGDARITAPVLLIWGEGDRFLGRSLAEASMGYCDAGHLTYVSGATHWVHHEKPKVLDQLILRFLGEAAVRPRR